MSIYTDQVVKKMTVSEVKAKLLALLDEVEAGDEIEITRHGRVIARLVPAMGPHALKGMFAGLVASSVIDEELFTTGVSWESQ